MIKNNNPTIIYSADELFKSFCDEKGDILVDENCDPDLIQDLNKYKTIDNIVFQIFNLINLYINL